MNIERVNTERESTTIGDLAAAFDSFHGYRAAYSYPNPGEHVTAEHIQNLLSTVDALAQAAELIAVYLYDNEGWNETVSVETAAKKQV